MHTHVVAVLVRLAALLVPKPVRIRFAREWQAELAHEGVRSVYMMFAVGVGVFKDALQIRQLEFAATRRRRRRKTVEPFYALGRDIRIAVRGLLRSPLYALIAIVTLALGLGGTSSIFALLDRVILDPLPYPDAERLVRLSNRVPGVEPGAEWNMASAQHFFFLQNARTIESIGAYRRDGANVETPAGPQRASTVRVSASLLSLIGARAQVGRIIDANDDMPGQPVVVILSDGFWRRQMGADRGVVGRTIAINEEPVEIVGVLEPNLVLPYPGATIGEGPDLWMPLQLNSAGPFQNSHVIPMVALLRPNTEPKEAEAELARLTRQLPEVFPNVYSQSFFDRYGFRTAVTPLKQYVVRDVAGALWTLTGALGVVLLIAVANVTNLFLVRMEERKAELTMRTALGASLGAIARLVMAESVTLALIGGVAGLLVGYLGVPAMVSIAPTALPRFQSLRFGLGNLVFAACLSVTVGVALAVFPIIQYRRLSKHTTSSGGRSITVGRERQRLRSALIVSQVALALTLVVAAGLLISSHRHLRNVDPGVQPDGVVTVQLIPTGPRYDRLSARWTLYREVAERARALPGVVAAGMTPSLPFSGGFGCTIQGFEDRTVYDRLRDAGMTTCAGQEPTTPGYFESMGIPILRGRGLENEDNDDPSRGVVVVSQAFADRFWPGEDPIGKGIAPSGRTQGPFYRVVGVVGDVYAWSLTEDPAIAVYYPVVPIPPSGGLWPTSMYLVIKTNLAQPSLIVPSLRRAVAEVDPAIPIANPAEMHAAIDNSMGGLTFMSVLLQIAAVTALLLASVGLYGVIAYLVTRRTKEIGMRIAMGARPGQVERLIVGKSFVLLATGLVLGVILALVGTQTLRGFLYGIEPTSPGAFITAIAVLSLVTLAASWLPARRAARIDPSDALRVE